MDIPKHVINRGTGAGGANANASGLPFENKTDLLNMLTIQDSSNPYVDRVIFNAHPGTQFLKPKTKTKLHPYMESIKESNIDIGYAHGCKWPDEVYIDPVGKNVFITEKKHQNKGGSVTEKLQTCTVKREFYNDKFPNFKVIYIYTLSDWFRTNCPWELSFVKKNNIPIFWGDESDYKKQIIEFMVNYS